MASHAEMLTGYPPSETGVWNCMQFRPIPRELTVFTRLEEHFGPQDFTTVWLSSKAKRLSSDPGWPWQEARGDIDVWDGDRYRPNRETGRLCIDYLRAHARPGAGFFMFLHFSDPDNKGHNYGENSPEYEAALVDDDEWLGRIRGTLDELGVGSTTAVCVVTDHGFDEGKTSHRQARDAWLATNWAPIRAGNQRDLAPTILSAFGVNWNRLDPPLPGKPLWASPD
jgi:hypothetical protein